MISMDSTEEMEGVQKSQLYYLFVEWRSACRAICSITDKIDGDLSHPLYIEADKKEKEARIKFLATPASKLQDILLKLKTAAFYEENIESIIMAETSPVASQALIAGINDIERVLFFKAEL